MPTEAESESESELDTRDRLEQSIKSPYDTDGEVWSALLTAISSEFNAHEDNVDDILDAKFVETASGEQLFKIASLFDMQQRDAETDNDFRLRVQTGLRSQLTSATVPEVREMVQVLFNITSDDFELVERAGIDVDANASFQIRLLADTVGELNVRPSNLNPLLNTVSAAGVNGGAAFLTPDANLRIVARSVRRTGPNELPPAELTLDFEPVVITEANESDVLELVLDVADVQRVKLSDDGLSSDALGSLSSGEWVLSHDNRN